MSTTLYQANNEFCFDKKTFFECFRSIQELGFSNIQNALFCLRNGYNERPEELMIQEPDPEHTGDFVWLYVSRVTAPQGNS